MERVLFAPKVFLTLGPLKLLGRAETVREAVAAAIVSRFVMSVSVSFTQSVLASQPVMCFGASSSGGQGCEEGCRGIEGEKSFAISAKKSQCREHSIAMGIACHARRLLCVLEQLLRSRQLAAPLIQGQWHPRRLPPWRPHLWLPPGPAACTAGPSPREPFSQATPLFCKATGCEHPGAAPASNGDRLPCAAKLTIR